MEFFTGERSWRQFYGFLERLPSWGYYKTALVMDEDWARRVVDLEERGDLVPPAADPENISPLGYSPEIGYLALIADRVELVRNAVIAVNSDGGGPSFKPLPRPTTALDRERERRNLDELLELDRYILGGGPPS